MSNRQASESNAMKIVDNCVDGQIPFKEMCRLLSIEILNAGGNSVSFVLPATGAGLDFELHFDIVIKKPDCH